MTERVSLVEAYDNKDVVSQIYRIREIAQGAEDKSAEAVQKADAAVAVVPVVEAAVATANAASQAAQQAAGQVTDCVKKTGSTVPQVISGTGGLQIAGDLSVGGDLTVSADGHVHMDASDIEVANMAIEKSGQKTVLSNDYGIDAPDTVVGTLDAAIVNAKRLIAEIDAKLNAYLQMVRTTGNQVIDGYKNFNRPIQGLVFDGDFETTDVGEIGYYREIVKIPRNQLSGIRQHLLYGITSRQRDRGWDFVSLYLNNGDPIGINLVLRSNEDAITYVLTKDNDYMYMYSVCKGTVGDSLQGTIVNASSPSFGYVTNISKHPETVNFTGIEVGRVTP